MEYFNTLENAQEEAMAKLNQSLGKLTMDQQASINKDLMKIEQGYKNGTDPFGNPLTDVSREKALLEYTKVLQNGVDPNTGKPITDAEAEARILALQDSYAVGRIKIEREQAELLETAKATLEYGINPETGKVYTKPELAQIEQAARNGTDINGKPLTDTQAAIVLEGVKHANDMELTQETLDVRREELRQSAQQWADEFGLKKEDFEMLKGDKEFQRTMDTIAMGMELAGDDPDAMAPYQDMMAEAMYQNITKSSAYTPEIKQKAIEAKLDKGEYKTNREVYDAALKAGMSKEQASAYIAAKNGSAPLKAGETYSDYYLNSAYTPKQAPAPTEKSAIKDTMTPEQKKDAVDALLTEYVNPGKEEILKESLAAIAQAPIKTRGMDIKTNLEKAGLSSIVTKNPDKAASASMYGDAWQFKDDNGKLVGSSYTLNGGNVQDGIVADLNAVAGMMSDGGTLQKLTSRQALDLFRAYAGEARYNELVKSFGKTLGVTK
jgi:hypothetical protein